MSNRTVKAAKVLRINYFCSLLSFLVSLILSPWAAAQSVEHPITFVLSTTPGSSERLRTVDGKVDQDRPGYFGETFYAAGDACKVNIEFKQAPWNRVLHQVKHGKTDAAFRASYNEERGTYAAYPRTESGDLDLSRALSSHSYSLFINADADLAWNGTSAVGEDRRVAVEASSAGVGIAERLGLQPVETSGDGKMIDLLRSGRVDGALGITLNFQKEINEAGILNERIKIATPPVEEKSSYIMFSQLTYDQYPEQVECFWSKIAQIMRTEEYKSLVASYQSEE